ncbi:hypothetical protein [Aureibacter tunicatorum]|uniref:Uncharacterized protein n=1 Tax=Aureibacter tunicatorum TaxID=866807 RepID=A0AAE4BVR5_9BACT|nr:hypothetical protein [Aureibacter tunicatorum]MDR6241963.1 hypothetical protein [Aureibacter tunicatorum]BDD07516.1 hypothetical protein AUTU_49990 [Aureibacter tunicatorum]
MKQAIAKVKIAEYSFDQVESIKIQSSMHQLGDKCTVRLPKKVKWGKGLVSLDEQDILKKGMEIVVEMGYDSDISERFKGYIRHIHLDDIVELECEDNIKWLEEHTFDSFSLKENANISELVQKILPSNSIPLSKALPIPVLSTGKLRIRGCSAQDGIKQISKLFGMKIFFKNGELSFHSAASQVNKVHKIARDKNMASMDAKLITVHDSRKIVELVVTNEQNKGFSLKIGNKGGEVKKIEYQLGANNLATASFSLLNHIINEQYDGMKGSITLFGLPMVEHGDALELDDYLYPDHNGTYWVESVITTLGKEGIRQQVELGRSTDYIFPYQPKDLLNAAIEELATYIVKKLKEANMGIELIQKLY